MTYCSICQCQVGNLLFWIFLMFFTLCTVVLVLIYPLMTTITVQHVFFCFWPTVRSSHAWTNLVMNNTASKVCYKQGILIWNDQESHTLSYSCCLRHLTNITNPVQQKVVPNQFITWCMYYINYSWVIMDIRIVCKNNVFMKDTVTYHIYI